MAGPLVLASTSRYRASLMAELGRPFETLAPDFDERALEHRFGELEPGEFAVELARHKASSVVPRCVEGLAGALVLAADQIAVVDVDGEATLLHQPGTVERAVEQLCALSGSTHRLVNGVVVLDTASGTWRSGIDEHVVTMREFTRDEARAYVERHRPLDCVGSYRIEDDADLVASVQGGDRSGVIGLPLPLVRQLLAP